MSPFQTMLRTVNRVDRLSVPKIIADPWRAIQLHAEMRKAIERVHDSGDDVFPPDADKAMEQVERKLHRIRERAHRAHLKFIITDPLRKWLAPMARNLHVARQSLRQQIRAELKVRENEVIDPRRPCMPS